LYSTVGYRKDLVFGFYRDKKGCRCLCAFFVRRFSCLVEHLPGMLSRKTRPDSTDAKEKLQQSYGKLSESVP
jgi:hypothetical protein